MSKVRAWCFTLNNPLTTELTFPDGSVRYAIWQLERGESGTLHLQGYVELSSPQRMAAMRRLIPGAHFEPRQGTREQARDYCRKEEGRQGGPWEFGDWNSGGSGKRNDILSVKRRLDEGANEADIADEYFGVWCRYYKAFREYRRLRTPIRTWKSEVYIFIGPPGTGKSRKCMEATGSRAYWKQRSQWWDGYEGQSDVVIDDFYGWLPFDTLLRLLDRYPLLVETKGGQAAFVARRIFITSNKHPRDWYRDQEGRFDLEALFRRFDFLTYFRALGDEQTFTSYAEFAGIN